MSKIKIGCETYTWQMPGEKYKGKLEHIMAIASQSGFQGIEPETSFIQHLSDPFLMEETLRKNNLELAVLVLVADWRMPQETEKERILADKWIDFLKHFPGTLLLLVQMPGKDRSELQTRQQNLLKCVNLVARRAAGKSIKCSYHPNSPGGSVFRTEEDYKILLEGLDTSVIKYTPDVGHIARGGMDPLRIIRQYRHLIDCVHFKDMFENGDWAPMGKGTINFEGITKELTQTGFEGWIIIEDECDEAITDPDGVVRSDGRFVREVLMPAVQ